MPIAQEREVARLISLLPWIALATAGESGAPSISYVPFAPVSGAFGIVVSRLAAHTANLLARRRAAVLLVDGDSAQPDVYARTRLSVDVSVTPNEPGSTAANDVWSALERRHGETVGMLRLLPDFEAVSLEPRSGRLILGFASAHDITDVAIKASLR